MASETTLTLIERMQHCKPGSPEANGLWDDFVSRYGKVMFLWAKACGLDDAGANDVSQEVFAKLFEHRFHGFDPGVRGAARPWLRKVTVNAVKDWCAKEDKRRTWEVDSMPTRLADLERRLEREQQMETYTAVVQHFIHTWAGEPVVIEVFRRLEEGQDIKTVAAALEISPATAYRYKDEVMVSIVEYYGSPPSLLDEAEEGRVDRIPSERKEQQEGQP